MKKTLMIFLSLLCLCNTFIAWASLKKINFLYVETINNSPFELRERLNGNRVEISKGQYFKWPTIFITDLSVKYKDNIGQWLKVPGCPEGDFLTSLNVRVSFNSLSPEIPLCSWSPVG